MFATDGGISVAPRLNCGLLLDSRTAKAAESSPPLAERLSCGLSEFRRTAAMNLDHGCEADAVAAAATAPLAPPLCMLSAAFRAWCIRRTPKTPPRVDGVGPSATAAAAAAATVLSAEVIAAVDVPVEARRIGGAPRGGRPGGGVGTSAVSDNADFSRTFCGRLPRCQMARDTSVQRAATAAEACSASEGGCAPNLGCSPQLLAAGGLPLAASAATFRRKRRNSAQRPNGEETSGSAVQPHADPERAALSAAHTPAFPSARLRFCKAELHRERR